jgi:hypothetical protein
MATHPLAPDILSKLGTKFEKDVFEAGLLSLDQPANPLRLNHFATSLRELSRIVLIRLAPDADIKACAWYSQAQGQPDITRHQRITYAVQAGLLDPFVTNTLQLDVAKMRKELLDSIKELSKFTHIGPAVFGVSGVQLDMTVTQSLEAFLAFLEMVAECRDSVENAVQDHAQQALHDELLSKTVDELDQLATHYHVEDTQVETVNVTVMDATRIEFSVSGYVECQFQYGSGADVRNDDGVVTYDSYPVTCEFSADIVTPLQVVVKPQTLKIDNESFYT